MAFLKKREPATAEHPYIPSRKKFRIKGTTIFIIVMLAYPVIQFCITWFGVNINSILLTFKDGYGEFLPLDDLFYNFETVFLSFTTDWDIYLASFAYIVLNCFITLPVSMLFAYFIFKKIWGGAAFKAIFYLPCILPIVALTFVYEMSFTGGSGANGFMYSFFSLFGVNSARWMTSDTGAKLLVWVFCFWTGIGYDVMLMSAAMARIPRELLESAKMDGITPMKEFFHVVIPLSWPTITTLMIFAMLGFFGTYLQPMLLAEGTHGTMTLGLKIFQDAQGDVSKYGAATLGLVWTIIGAPIILAVRNLMNRCFKEVTF